MKLNDWSGLSYNEVKRQLEEYRSKYSPKDEGQRIENAKLVEEDK